MQSQGEGEGNKKKQQQATISFMSSQNWAALSQTDMVRLFIEKKSIPSQVIIKTIHLLC